MTPPTGTDYSDTTPDVLITYDAFGRQQTVSQTNQSSITYAYDPSTLALDTETIAYDLDHNGISDFTRVLDRSKDSILRDTGWQLKDGSTVENQVTYGYHPTHGRLSTVTGGGNISSPQSFTYEYTNNSNLIQSVTGPIHTVVNTWATDRDVLELKENKVGTTLISGFDYVVNSIGQRSGVSTAGTAFFGTRGWDWGYNARGEVVKADSSVTAFDRSYEYDAIGNRKKAANSLTPPSSDNYTSNALNQYASIQQGGTGVSPVYDDDGNATSYPLPVSLTTSSTMAWDGENRMISSTVGDTMTVYLYDPYFRRIAKSTGTDTVLYLYDDWNTVGDYIYSSISTPHPPALLRSYLWGSDFSGSLQGAGGIGGLLGLYFSSSPLVGPFFPSYDGNWNVSEYIGSGGATSVHFEYDSFGSTIEDSDSEGKFDIRFCTKRHDEETGMLYYGYRSYNPNSGRWLSRDPLEESGGENLYGMIENDLVNSRDFLGLEEDKCKKSITIDVGHGGDSGKNKKKKTKRSADRAKKPNPNHKFMSVGCGSNKYNEDYNKAGNGVPDYPKNDKTEDPDSGILENNGFDRNDLTGAADISGKIDKAIEAAKKEAKDMCSKPPDCCKSVTIKIECEKGGDPSVEKADRHFRGGNADNGDTKCGTSEEVPCEE